MLAKSLQKPINAKINFHKLPFSSSSSTDTPYYEAINTVAAYQ